MMFPMSIIVGEETVPMSERVLLERHWVLTAPLTPRSGFRHDARGQIQSSSRVKEELKLSREKKHFVEE